MAAKHIDSKYFQAPTQALVNAVHIALTQLCNKPPNWVPGTTHAIASTGFTLLSYGEMINVYVQPSGEVVVVSECSFPLQLIDWGVNKKNCTRVLDSVAAQINPNMQNCR